MTSLARLYQALGRFEGFEALTRQTLELRRRVLGERHIDTLMTRSHLAELLAEQTRSDEAEACTAT